MIRTWSEYLLLRDDSINGFAFCLSRAAYHHLRYKRNVRHLWISSAQCLWCLLLPFKLACEFEQTEGEEAFISGVHSLLSLLLDRSSQWWKIATSVITCICSRWCEPSGSFTARRQVLTDRSQLYRQGFYFRPVQLRSVKYTLHLRFHLFFASFSTNSVNLGSFVFICVHELR